MLNYQIQTEPFNLLQIHKSPSLAEMFLSTRTIGGLQFFATENGVRPTLKCGADRVSEYPCRNIFRVELR
jgi:hypothetical protein